MLLFLENGALKIVSTIQGCFQTASWHKHDFRLHMGCQRAEEISVYVWAGPEMAPWWNFKTFSSDPLNANSFSWNERTPHQLVLANLTIWSESTLSFSMLILASHVSWLLFEPPVSAQGQAIWAARCVNDNDLEQPPPQLLLLSPGRKVYCC